MKNAPKFVDGTHVLVSKEFAKNTRIFGTPEYKMWKEINIPFLSTSIIPYLSNK